MPNICYLCFSSKLAKGADILLAGRSHNRSTTVFLIGNLAGLVDIIEKGVVGCICWMSNSY